MSALSKNLPKVDPLKAGKRPGEFICITSLVEDGDDPLLEAIRLQSINQLMLDPFGGDRLW